MSYRYDKRTESEFKKDIKERTLRERELFLLWIDSIERTTGKRPFYRDTGCGQSGEFLEDHEVSTDADFEVEGFGKVEVKYADKKLDSLFHLKVNQVKKYCNQNVTILMVNGAATNAPVFTMLTTKCLQQIIDFCEAVSWQGFGGKRSYRIPIDMFIWRNLK
jgi:hypothetical protein